MENEINKAKAANKAKAINKVKGNVKMKNQMVKTIMRTMKRVFVSVLTAVKEWLNGVITRSKAHRVQARHKHLVEESRRRLQVRMWNGEIYFCVDDVPLLHESDLDYCMADYVELARETWVDYHEGGGEDEK